MPTRLRYKKTDPNGKGRGSGPYYHRGHGVWSLYSTDRDYKKLSKGWKIHKIGRPAGSRILHHSDGKLPI